MRHDARASSFNHGRGPVDDRALYDHIQQLRAELRGCYFTPRERAAVQAELTQALAEQAELDRAFDIALEALSNAETGAA